VLFLFGCDGAEAGWLPVPIIAHFDPLFGILENGRWLLTGVLGIEPGAHARTPKNMGESRARSGRGSNRQLFLLWWKRGSSGLKIASEEGCSNGELEAKNTGGW
jgi:hypothetical protein